MPGRIQVLLVEPEDRVLAWLSDVLSVDGYRVTSARDGDEALRCFRNERVDLILSEVFLLALNGVELLKRVRAEAADVAVVLMSRDAPIQTVVAAMREGADDFLDKPIDSERLRLCCEKVLERRELSLDNAALKRMQGIDATAGSNGGPVLVAESEAMQEVLEKVALVAPTDLTVLVQGESGVGKELVASQIHRSSSRVSRPLIAINCGVLHANLLESELFGHEKGSFTGATNEHQGIFEVADKGTLFLDEIGEMGIDLQVKLLRVLETGELRRVGGHKVLRVDVRIIAATNRNLADDVAAGRFREDLFYRLNVIDLLVPALRDRPAEIAPLVEVFVERGRRRGLRPRRFAPDAIEVLQSYPWPGNVRELENLVERALILAPQDLVRAKDLPAFLDTVRGSKPVTIADDGDYTLAEMEKRHIERMLGRNKGNKVRTAKKLGINVKTLYNKIKGYEIDEAKIVKK